MMKKNTTRHALALFLFLLAGVCAFAAEPADEVAAMLGKGDAAGLCACLASDADVVIQGKNISKQARCEELTGFFAAHPARGFTLKHQGSKNEAGFLVGTLKTDGQNFRINLFMRNASAGEISIRQLRIEKE